MTDTYIESENGIVNSIEQIQLDERNHEIQTPISPAQTHVYQAEPERQNSGFQLPTVETPLFNEYADTDYHLPLVPASVPLQNRSLQQTVLLSNAPLTSLLCDSAPASCRHSDDEESGITTDHITPLAPVRSFHQPSITVSRNRSITNHCESPHR
jgi:hypothetical protein